MESVQEILRVKREAEENPHREDIKIMRNNSNDIIHASTFMEARKNQSNLKYGKRIRSEYLDSYED